MLYATPPGTSVVAMAKNRLVQGRELSKPHGLIDAEAMGVGGGTAYGLFLTTNKTGIVIVRVPKTCMNQLGGKQPELQLIGCAINLPGLNAKATLARFFAE